MPNLNKTINELVIDFLSINLAGVEEENSDIDGHIKGCDKKFVYIKIEQGFEELLMFAESCAEFNVANFAHSVCYTVWGLRFENHQINLQNK